MKCAVVEYNYCHDETLPTLVYLLNNLGISVDVYASRRAIRNNPFAYTTGLSFSLRQCDGVFFKLRSDRFHFRHYDFLILNSLEPKAILERVADIQVPILGVMHNGNLIRTDPDYASFFGESGRKPLVLAGHISDFLSGTTVARWVSPVLLGQVKPTKSDNLDQVRLCVQGNLEFERRNYECLLDAIEQLIVDGVRKLKVMIIGRNGTNDGLIFREQIRKRNLVSFFEFSKGELPYKNYYEFIAKANFLLPLVDTTSSHYRPYFLDKVTTSVLVSIGMCVIPIIHEQLADLYGIKSESVTYEDGELPDALKRAFSTDRDTLEKLHSGLASKREALLSESIDNMRETLRDLGLIPKEEQRQL
ncbi:MAG: hypothetical protein EWM72_03176 [Nitrospira sp.]|nr:MAG: hypothetical protein EWM72_03176 [Nitrospira sp.]